MNDPIIKINLSKPTDLDFEVSVTTNCAEDKPCVRFSVELEAEKRWLSLVCERDEETKKWHVTIPALKPIVDRDEYPFVLEVIIEDYYFVPAKGMLQPVEAPTVNMSSPTKPSVTASFTSSAEEEKKDDEEKEEKEEKLEERAPGAGTAFGGMEAPTNKLLKPEFQPKTTHVEKPAKKEKDIADVVGASNVTPGDQGMTADTRAQPDGKGTFSAREVAQQIVKGMTKAKKPESKGTLFKRIGDKAVVEGLEPKEVKEELDKKAQKVKDILKG